MINIVWFHLDEVLKVIKIIEAKGIIMVTKGWAEREIIV